MPFFALYPDWLRARILTVGAFGSGSRSPSLAEARTRMRYFNSIGRRELEALFPNAAITMEKPFGVPTSLLATRGGAGVSRP